MKITYILFILALSCSNIIAKTSENLLSTEQANTFQSLEALAIQEAIIKLYPEINNPEEIDALISEIISNQISQNPS